MDYPKFMISNRKEESISIQRVKRTYLFTFLFHHFQSASIKQSRKYTEKVYPQLFEYAMIVSLRQGDAGVYEPYVIYKFPEIVSIGHVQQIIAFGKTFSFWCMRGMADIFRVHVLGYCRWRRPHHRFCWHSVPF